MDDRRMLEHTNTEFLTLSYADEEVDSHPELTDQCTNMSK